MSAADKASSSSTEEKGSRDPKEIRVEIEETRGELGETVAAVTEKTDVKKHVQAKKEDLKAQAGAKADEAKAKLKEVGEKAQEAAPDSARDGVQQAQRLAQENQVPLAIAGAFITGVLLGRLLSR